jgi:hypothetical protein
VEEGEEGDDVEEAGTEATKKQKKSVPKKGGEEEEEEEEGSEEEADDASASGEVEEEEGEDEEDEGSGSTILSEFFQWSRNSFKAKQKNSAQPGHLLKIFRDPMFTKTMVCLPSHISDFISLPLLTKNTCCNFTWSNMVKLSQVFFFSTETEFLASNVWNQQGPLNPKSSIMVLFVWENYVESLPKGFSIHFMHNTTSDHHQPAPTVAIAYHSQLDERGRSLASRLSEFFGESTAQNDTFVLFSCEKPEDFTSDDNLPQMSTRYWAFFLIQLSRLQTMVSLFLAFLNSFRSLFICFFLVSFL